MKQTNILKIAGLAVIASIAASFARADIPVYENKISIYGYAAGSIQWTQDKFNHDPSVSDTTFALDAAKLGLAFDYAPVTARLSVYVPSTDGNASDDFYLLEANATYTARNGGKITFGRFQSWVGYEAFDIPNGNFITAATASLTSLIPNFHEGVKWEGDAGSVTYGVALLDSIYPDATKPYRGDGDIGNGYAIEAFAAYKAERLSGQFALGYQSDKNNNRTDTWVFDIYGEYKLANGKTTLGAEFTWKTEEPASGNRIDYNNRVNTLFGLVMVKHQINEKFYIAGRMSMGQEKAKVYQGQTTYDNGAPVYENGTRSQFTKYSATGAYTINKNIAVGVEASVTDYINTHVPVGVMSNKMISDAYYIGAHVVLKF